MKYLTGLDVRRERDRIAALSDQECEAIAVAVNVLSDGMRFAMHGMLVAIQHTQQLCGAFARMTPDERATLMAEIERRVSEAPRDADDVARRQCQHHDTEMGPLVAGVATTQCSHCKSWRQAGSATWNPQGYRPTNLRGTREGGK